MKPYYERDGAQIYLGDCREVVPSLRLTVATVITDPPYGLTADKRDYRRATPRESSRQKRDAEARGGFMGCRWDSGVPDADTWLAFHSSLVPGSLVLSFGGTRTWHRLACAIEDAGYEIRDTLMWLYGQGFPKSLDVGKATGLQAWSGYGTALKPAWEPIILAMKPTNGTFAQNALLHGVAGLNVDGGRIGTNVETWPVSRSYHASRGPKPRAAHGSGDGETVKTGAGPPGRYPANLMLDESAAAMLDEQSGRPQSGKMRAGTARSARSVCYGEMPDTATLTDTPGDKGAASRFFYVAKANNTDRGHVSADALPLFCEGEYEHRNIHPTVKPTSLMRYLCRLTRTPTGGLVLDPFMGSGSTLVAAVAEGRPCVGVEIEERYAEIAAKRLMNHSAPPNVSGRGAE